MPYQVNLKNKARKDLKKLSPSHQKKVLQVLDELSLDPFLGVKLQGQLTGLYKVKIPPIRVIYEPDIPNKTILVKTIGHRQGVYKN